jgi:hypothetical protein
MAWEHGRYYTRSRRTGGKIIREYVGSGPAATLLAEIDATERQERLKAQATRREKRAQDEQLEARIDEFCRLAEAAARAELLDLGFHEHKGQWRRKRGT